jgi:hypothetical protein
MAVTLTVSPIVFLALGQIATMTHPTAPVLALFLTMDRLQIVNPVPQTAQTAPL